MSYVADTSNEGTIRVALDLPVRLLRRIESLKCQLGFSSRGEVVVLLLEELLPSESPYKG